MGMALAEARAAAEHDDVPIGAVVVRGGEPLAAAHNERELRSDPTAHAEILVLRAAAQAVDGWRIPDATLYVPRAVRDVRGRDGARPHRPRRLRGRRSEGRSGR